MYRERISDDRLRAVVEHIRAWLFTEPEAKTPASEEPRILSAAGHEKMTCHVALALPTFTATAEMAAISRLWGGYHIRTDNEVGLVCGRQIAEYEWSKIQTYFNGTAKPQAQARR